MNRRIARCRFGPNRHFHRGILLLGILLVSLMGQAQNLLPNPGFESGTTGWFGFGSVSFSTVGTMAHSGSQSAWIQNRTETWQGVAQSVLGILESGKTYSLSAWIRLAGGSNETAQLTIKKVDGSGTSYQSVAAGRASATAWTQVAGSYSLSVSGSLTELTLYLEGPAAGVSFYADDFDLELVAAAPVGTIDAATVHQTIEGFGGAIAFYNNWITAHPYKQEIYTNVFQGLNLSLLRLGNWFRYQGTANFDASTTEIVSNANRILGRSLAIEMSSWSPPGFLKSNGTTGNGGTLVKTNGGFAYTHFANYWYDSLLWYKSNGIVPAYISIQNEPDYADSWDTCVFHPTEDTVNGTNYASYAKALAATYQRLTNLPSPPKLLGPETAGIGSSSVQSYAAAMDTNFYGLAHHLYNGGQAGSADSFLPALAGLGSVFPSKPRFMTEYGETDMLQTALLIHHSLTAEEASAYIFWSLVWPVGGPALLIQENPWDRSSWTNAPAGATTQAKGYWLTPQYYALKHFSAFIGYGYQRVETPGNDPKLRLSAFRSPDGRRLVAVLICPDSAPYSATLALNGFVYATSSAYQTAGTNAQISRFAALGPAPADLQWTLPGSSITTVVFDAPLLAGPPANPTPANGATNVSRSPALTWTAGSNAVSHRLFFGASSNTVFAAQTNSAEFKGLLSTTNFSPPLLASTARFFWRVDELAQTNVARGPVWTFATAPNAADAPKTTASLGSHQQDFALTFPSRLGQTYRIQRADHLPPTAWSTVAEGVPGTDSLLQFTETNGPFATERYFRVLLLAP